MKQLLSFEPLFDPTAKTLDFRLLPGFQADLLYGVINVTRNQILYAPGSTTYGGTFVGPVLTLTFDTSNYAQTDQLNVYYESSPTVAGNNFYNNEVQEQGGRLDAIFILMSQLLAEVKVTNYLLQQGFYPATKDDLTQLRSDMQNQINPDGTDNTGLG